MATTTPKLIRTRRLAYFGAFKWFFQKALMAGTDRRTAWAAAKNDAAAYSFLAPDVNLSVWVPVWAR